MITSLYKHLTLKVFIDKTYTTGTADNQNSYEHIYATDGAFKRSSCGIVLTDGKEISSSCVICRPGHALITEHSFIMKEDRLFLAFTDSVFCLSVPKLQLQWQTTADLVACFELFSIDGDVISVGECSVCRISNKDEIAWSFTGADIFVKWAFNEAERRVLLIDLDGTEYLLNEDGNNY